MGGYGSGRRGGRATIEACAPLVLDVARIMGPVLAALGERRLRTGEVLEAGPIRWAWTRGGDAEPCVASTVWLKLDLDGGKASIDLESRTGEYPGLNDQRVALEAASCRFGGVRWYWVCPATNRRAVKLCLPRGGRRFLSRQAYGLAYASQREDSIGRAHRRAARLHCRLGSPHRRAFCGTPAKPKWMRWPTYERLAAGLEEIDAGLEDAMERMAARMLG